MSTSEVSLRSRAVLWSLRPPLADGKHRRQFFLKRQVPETMGSRSDGGSVGASEKTFLCKDIAPEPTWTISFFLETQCSITALTSVLVALM